MTFITQEQELRALVNIYAGSHRLKTELTKLKISYVKVCKGAKTSYILRGKGIENKLIITL